jgi:para-nitrobenzyl esterase
MKITTLNPLIITKDPDYAVSEMMSDYWTNFAKTGDPNGETVPEWAAYTEDNKNIQILDV